MTRRHGIVLFGVAALLAAGWFLRDRASPAAGSQVDSRDESNGFLRWFSGAPAPSDSATTSTSGSGVRKPVRGIVVDAVTQEVIGEAKVVLRKSEADVAETVTGEDGRYGFDDKNGAHAVIVAAAGYALCGARIQEGVEQRIELDTAVRISGVVVDADGAPVADAEVWTNDEERNEWPKVESSRVRTAADGTFSIVDSPAGRIEVYAEHDVHADGSSYVGGVAPGRERRDVRVVLGKAARVAGIVRMPDGTPAEGATVSWHEEHVYIADEKTIADALGQFTLHVKPGKGTLLAVAKSGEDVKAEIEAAAETETRRDLTLIAQQPVIGRVIDGNGDPVSGATVSMTASGSGASKTAEATSDESGRFELKAPSAAVVHVTARKDFASSSRVQMRTEKELVVQIFAEGRLRVRLLDEHGDPATKPWSAYGRSKDGKYLEFDNRDPVPGQFVLTGPPGEWTVVARSAIPGAPEQETRANVPVAPPEVTIDLILKDTDLRVARGVVLDDEGAPLRAAHVSLTGKIDPSDAPDSRAGRLERGGARRTDASGRFEVHAAPGAQRVFVYHPEHRPVVVPFTMPASGDVDVGAIRLKKGRSQDYLFEGVGIGVQFESAPAGPPKVRFVYEDSPAAAAGIKFGDVFLEIDGTALTGMPMKEILPISRGAPGTTAHITIQREGVAPFEIDVERARFLY